MENKFIVSLSPHVHGGDSIQKNMYGVLIALFPAFIVSLLFFGLGALIVTATSVAACVFFEWAIGKYLLKKETTTICDGSAIITGVLLAFNLPSNLPIWIIILGALFAIGVGKMSFGGLGNNPFNPALYVSPVLQLLTGGLMLGAIFMATDYVTSPMSKKGMLIYGVCIGLLTVIIRLFGAYPEGMSFAILIMNAFTPLINTYCKPKRFGEVAKKK